MDYYAISRAGFSFSSKQLIRSDDTNYVFIHQFSRTDKKYKLNQKDGNQPK